MIIKTYEDGSEFTHKHVLALAGFAVVCVPVVVKYTMWKDKRQTKKAMKKYGWPEEAIKKL